jgi:hypothetical protein
LNPPEDTRPRKVFQALVKDLERDLDHFDPGLRGQALEKLISLEIPSEQVRDSVNLHTHTFFSYNAEGWSPSRYAWEAHKAGLYAAGIIDFDGIDGVWEFLSAAESLSLRATAGIEIRAFLQEFAGSEIDSPGEPGVHYMAGSGLVVRPKSGSPEEAYLLRLQLTSAKRSQELVDRINSRLPEIAIDYTRVVRTRTPSGYGSERHFVSAYVEQAKRKFPSPLRCADFWSHVLAMPKTAVVSLMHNQAAFEEKVRGRLMKRGGLGYVQPGPETFPPAKEAYAWAKACGAVPMDSWLDGTSDGESRARELLECNRSLGARALNLIPDRNWNIKDPEEKRRKLDNLARIVSLASAWHMPLHIGTEGNKHGLPFVDNLDGPELSPFKAKFMSGARVLIGHAVLARFADFPYAGEAAEAEFRRDTKSMNGFFEAVGALPPLDTLTSRQLREMGPKAALGTLRESIRVGRWSGIRQDA